VLHARWALPILLAPVLHALAREVDGALGTLLHTSLSVSSLPFDTIGLVDPRRAALHAALLTGAATALVAALAARRVASERTAWVDAVALESRLLLPLLLRPGLTVLALASVAVQPAYPYGFTLPVALTQDWGVAQDALVLATMLAMRCPAPRLPVPSAFSLFFMAFLAYALASPSWSHRWENHPGNEPKTLRTAVALGLGFTLDAEGVSGPMETLAPRPVLAATGGAVRVLTRQSAEMVAAIGRGPSAVGAEAIRATRVTRQTVRGKEGGVFYVLPPGPAALLAPALRIDRFVNLARGTQGRLAVTVLLWNALAAALVAAVFLLARDASGRPGLAAAAAAGFAFVPPYLFYFYQFYPEMLGALVLAVALRWILYGRSFSAARMLALGLLLATLPWLHQKFLPVWVVLTLMAIVVAVDRLVTLRALVALVLPQAATLFFTALFNFAITGSVRPDALYLAWGPKGIATARLGQGLLGLLLDARFGLLPYAPLYLAALAGLLLRGSAASRLRLAILPAAVYYVTVASADNWSGAVCHLGRYLMPVTPLLVAAIVVLLAALPSRSGAVAVLLSLSAWTALLAAALRRDPHAANDCAVLLSKAVFADGNVYLPNLLLRSWADGAPGLVGRILAWSALALLLALWLRRAAFGRGGASPLRAMTSLAFTLLAAGFALERWPTSRPAPNFAVTAEIGPGTTAFALGTLAPDGPGFRAQGGRAEWLVRSTETMPALGVLAVGRGTVTTSDGATVRLGASGTRFDAPLLTIKAVEDGRGGREILYRLRLEMKAEQPVHLRLLPSFLLGAVRG
jgi:hypothetical protein